MIFPKDKQKLQLIMDAELKKEALELIVSLYLSRNKDEDITFLYQNFISIQNLAAELNSCIVRGLSSDNAQKNSILYGENQLLQSNNLYSFFEIIKEQLLSIYSIIFFLTSLIVLIYTLITQDRAMLVDVVYIIFSYLIPLGIRVFLHFINCRKLCHLFCDKNRKQLYKVLRNGVLTQIREDQLVVGDIVQLGFKEKVPASGLLVSPHSITVKQRFSENKMEQKLNLQQCRNKIGRMDNLSLKVCYEKKNLPSPVLLRGSELIQGSTYLMMILSVNEQNLLKSYNVTKQQKLFCFKYDHWVKDLLKRWKAVTFGSLVIALTALVFGLIIQRDLLSDKGQFSFKFICDILLKICSWSTILSCVNIRVFLLLCQICLLMSIDNSQNWHQYLTTQRIICSEQKIFQNKKLTIMKYAVCQQIQLLDQAEISRLNPQTVSKIQQMRQILKFQDIGKQNEKFSQFSINNQKRIKIIQQSSFATSHENYMQKIHPINNQKYNRNDQINNFCILKQDYQQVNNIKNQIQSRGYLTAMLQLTGKQFKTYYYQYYSVERIKKISHILFEGNIIPMCQQKLQQMIQLARKIELVFELTPVILGCEIGSLDKKPLRTLLCVAGAKISQDNKIISSFIDFQSIGIKSIILISKNSNGQYDLDLQQIIQDYVDHNWVSSTNSSKVVDLQKIAKECGRFICSQCLIVNCDCKDKIEEVSHIQPFIQKSNEMKILYNTDESSIQFLEKAFKQLRFNHILINSEKTSAQTITNSIINCLLFLQQIRRSLALWYIISYLFFFNSFCFWLRDIAILQPKQITLFYGILQTFFLLTLCIQISANIRDLDRFNHKKICFMDRSDTLFIYILLLLTIVTSQILFNCCNLIPQISDHYDTLISEYSLNADMCKYGPNQSVTKQFISLACSMPGGRTVYSKISTILILYLYYTCWFAFLVKHRNFKCIKSIALYFVSFITFIMLTKFIPSAIFLYQFGLSIIQVAIIGICVFLTVTISLILSKVLNEDIFGLGMYFSEELQSCIDFGDNKNEKYCEILKNYNDRNEISQNIII